MRAPEVIYLSRYTAALLKQEGSLSLPIRVIGEDTDIKYLSDQFVNEMLAEKDREIERLKARNKEVYNDGYANGQMDLITN